MNEITTFNFNEMPVRIVMNGDDPQFVAADVSAILEYASAKDMTRMLDDDEKGRHLVPTPGGNQEMITITEPGLYKAIMRSQKSEAKPFQRWVTHDVLPTIRKTGAYVHPKARQASPLKTLTDAARAFAVVRKTIKEIGCNDNAATISANQVIQKTVGINLLEMAGQTHLIAANQQEQYYTPTELGKMCGLSGREVNKLLEQDGLQVNIAGRWEPTEKGRPHCVILDTGKKHSSGVPVTQIKWVPSVMQAYITTEAA